MLNAYMYKYTFVFRRNQTIGAGILK